MGVTSLSVIACNVTCLAHYNYGTTFVCRFMIMVCVVSQCSNYVMFLDNFFFLAVLYFCLCKSCSSDENKDTIWNGPTGLKVD